MSMTIEVSSELELYEEKKDPYEWTNLARASAAYDSVKKDLAAYFPKTNKQEVKERNATDGEGADQNSEPPKPK